MGLRISTNVQSLAAQRALGINSNAQKQSLERLGSGQRINRAADDAAGLAISEKMKASIRSIRQDTRNAQDGISIIQTAEGGLTEVANILVRMRELSVQSASDTLSDTERGFIDKEVQQMNLEVGRIAEETMFNGRTKLLNGKGGDLDIQIGLAGKEEDRITIHQSQTDATLEKLGLNGINVSTKQSAQENLGRLDQAINTLSTSRAGLGAMQNRLSSAINSLQNFEENLSQSKSRISDADFASETSEMAKNQILSQAGTSILAQANQNPQLALKLIG